MSRVNLPMKMHKGGSQLSRWPAAGCWIEFRMVVLVAAVIVCSLSHAADLTYMAISIPTRDTNTLAADLWYAPPSPQAKPVILIQTPYNRKLYRAGILPGYAGGGFPASTNYNYVIVDWRGFFESSPASVPGYDRGKDGYDCVEWIAAQTWSNGRIGTWGSSALGYIQYQTAFQNPPPPHLSCCTIQVRDFQTRYDNYYYGGDYRKEHVETMASLGLTVPSIILAHPTRDSFWVLAENQSYSPDRMHVPALIVGGWFDHFPDQVLRSFSDLRQSSDAAVRDKHRFIYGPWTHGGVGQAEQGILTFPNVTNLYATEMMFWDYTLRDMTNNGWAGQPVMEYYQMGENIWMDGTNWAGIPRSTRSLYLRAGGLLSDEPPGSGEGADMYAYDPNDPTPAFGGSRFAQRTADVAEGPQDQSTNIETRADVLVYSTPVLTNDLRLNGSMLVTLYASSDRTDTDFAVRLTDVYPDGRSIIMTQGIRRGRFRNSVATATLMTPGTVYAIPIELQNLALTFRKGHRLRLVISSADYPHYDLNLNDGGPMYTNGTPLVATNSIFHDAAHLSRLDFQILPDDSDSDGLPDVWEADSFGSLHREGSGDCDGDGLSDRGEYLAGTSPTNEASVLRIDNIRMLSSSELEVTWQSVTNRHYDLLAATGGLSSVFIPIATNIGVGASHATTNITPPDGEAVFFRVQTRL
ncbi:MAG: hypothetical protein C0404_05925 [Verrucomicrobia bacterium]|nr:hypothetical protein [Verrucomicrobiota bacterium]